MSYLCKRCGEIDPQKFYKTNNAKTKCKKCHTMEVHHTKRVLKIRAVEYLGGKCGDCGKVGNPWIYDFHHLDPSKKDWNWGNRRTSNWEALKKEINKCVLLCSNCHRERHFEEWVETLVEHHPYYD
jgi:hypothetical protein